MKRLLDDFFYYVYLIGIVTAPALLAGLILLGNRHPKLISLDLEQKMALFLEKLKPNKVECPLIAVSLAELGPDSSWNPVSKTTQLKQNHWYSSFGNGEIKCASFSLLFPGSNTVFRIISTSFDLPIIEVPQGTLSVTKTSSPELGIYVSGWGTIFWTRPERLKISKTNSYFGPVVSISGSQWKESSIFVVRNSGFVPNVSVQLEWENPQLITVFSSDMLAGFNPSKKELFLY